MGNVFSKRRFDGEHLARKQRRDVIRKFVRKFSCFNLNQPDPDEKHLTENLVPKLDMTSLLISFLQSD